MGDSACIVHGFSYASAMPNESKQGNLMLALGDSVSFGRFMNESLSWEKWSTFSQKNYVEEAERYSQPGSVAQKKAFFEAHYKRAAARKVAALVEQGSVNKEEAEGGVHDNEDTEQRLRLDARSDVDGGRMEEKVGEGMEGGVEEMGKDAENGVICANEVLEKSHRLKNSPIKFLNLENHGTVSASESWTPKVDRPLPKQDFLLGENGPSKKDGCRSSTVKESSQMKTWKDPLILAKQVCPHLDQDCSGAKSSRKPSVDSIDERISSSKSARSESVSINPVVTTQSENDRMGSPLNSSGSGSRSSSHKRHLLSTVFSKSSAERSASERKQKPEEKFNGSWVQKMQQQKMMKDKAGNRFSKLSCIFCFKASPSLDKRESSDKMEQGTVSVPPPPPPLMSFAKNSSMKSSNNKAKIHTKSFAARITHENAPPNIQQ